MSVLLSALIAALLLQAPAQPPANRPADAQRQAGGEQPEPKRDQADPAGSVADIVSIEHIRKELERKPALTFGTPTPNTPRFRVEVQGNRFNLPDFLGSFQIPPSPVPQPFGGSDHYEMMRLITPPQYWGSAPFTNADLLKMSALTGAYGLVGALVKKGIDARADAAAARAHQEVQQELTDLAEHNARVAAGQADEATDKAARAKKKAAETKKQKEKKKGPGG